MRDLRAIIDSYPNAEEVVWVQEEPENMGAWDFIRPHLTEELKTAYNYRMAANGASLTQWAGAITDTNDIESRGFEAEIIFNPTRNWRIAFNAAKQETILTNIAPGLTKLLQEVWLPHLEQFGAVEIARKEYLKRLEAATAGACHF